MKKLALLAFFGLFAAGLNAAARQPLFKAVNAENTGALKYTTVVEALAPADLERAREIAAGFTAAIQPKRHIGYGEWLAAGAAGGVGRFADFLGRKTVAGAKGTTSFLGKCVSTTWNYTAVPLWSGVKKGGKAVLTSKKTYAIIGILLSVIALIELLNHYDKLPTWLDTRRDNTATLLDASWQATPSWSDTKASLQDWATYFKNLPADAWESEKVQNQVAHVKQIAWDIYSSLRTVFSAEARRAPEALKALQSDFVSLQSNCSTVADTMQTSHAAALTTMHDLHVAQLAAKDKLIAAGEAALAAKDSALSLAQQAAEASKAALTGVCENFKQIYSCGNGAKSAIIKACEAVGIHIPTNTCDTAASLISH